MSLMKRSRPAPPNKLSMSPLPDFDTGPELREYVEASAERYMQAGLNRDEAWRAARRATARST